MGTIRMLCACMHAVAECCVHACMLWPNHVFRPSPKSSVTFIREGNKIVGLTGAESRAPGADVIPGEGSTGSMGSTLPASTSGGGGGVTVGGSGPPAAKRQKRGCVRAICSGRGPAEAPV